jgi:hypothetical protein
MSLVIPQNVRYGEKSVYLISFLTYGLSFMIIRAQLNNLWKIEEIAKRFYSQMLLAHRRKAFSLQRRFGSPKTVERESPQMRW